MSEDKQMIDLFDRWEKVWHERQFDLIESCIEDNYIRHLANGTRTVTRDDYAKEVATVQKERPDFRTVVYDRTFEPNRAWFRFAFVWTDVKTGQKQSIAGLQTYRCVNGRLAETWQAMQPEGSSWSDAPLEHWTSPSKIK